jgi:opacity protein-like surface antigen
VPIPKYEQLRLNAGFTAFLNYVDVDGSDELNLDGRLEQLDIGQDEFTFGWAAGIGAEWDVGAVTLFANYRYVDDDTVPIAVREDAGPSHAEIERAQAHTGMLGARLTF